MSYLRPNRSVVLWLSWAIVCGIAATTVSGHQSGPPPTRPEYLIEYHTAEGCLFAPINGPANRGSLLHALGRPDKYLPDTSGQPILSKIAVHAEQAGGLWSLTVFAGAGEFYDAGDRNIATFKAQTLENLIKSQNPKSLKAWCAATIAKYTRWHALAEAVSPH